MKGYFFNAQPTSDIEKHPSGFDREYDAEDFNRFMGTFFSDGIFIRGNENACKVTASGLKLSVTPGIVLVDGGQCHFEEGDGLTLEGSGNYRIMCRRNSAAGVRAFELVAVQGYPAPVREGDIYDMCLAQVRATSSTATVTDTRSDSALCGYAALTGQPPYYPPDSDNLPYVLWLYTLGFPMTAEQKAAVEGNPSLMATYNNTKLIPATTAQAQVATNDTNFMTPVKSKAQVDCRLASQIAAEAGTDSAKLMTPQRTKQAIENFGQKCANSEGKLLTFGALDYTKVYGVFSDKTLGPDLSDYVNSDSYIMGVPVSGKLKIWDRTSKALLRTKSSTVQADFVGAQSPVMQYGSDTLTVFSGVTSGMHLYAGDPRNSAAMVKIPGLTDGNPPYVFEGSTNFVTASFANSRPLTTIYYAAYSKANFGLLKSGSFFVNTYDQNSYIQILGGNNRYLYLAYANTARNLVILRLDYTTGVTSQIAIITSQNSANTTAAVYRGGKEALVCGSFSSTCVSLVRVTFTDTSETVTTLFEGYGMEPFNTLYPSFAGADSEGNVYSVGYVTSGRYDVYKISPAGQLVSRIPLTLAASSSGMGSIPISLPVKSQLLGGRLAMINNGFMDVNTGVFSASLTHDGGATALYNRSFSSLPNEEFLCASTRAYGWFFHAREMEYATPTKVREAMV